MNSLQYVPKLYCSTSPMHQPTKKHNMSNLMDESEFSKQAHTDLVILLMQKMFSLD